MIINQIVKGSGTTPTGTLPITNNGTYDVTNYATADVNVPTTAPAHYIEKSVDANGKLVGGSSFIDLTGVTDVGDYVLYYAYYQNTAISGAVDMSDLTAISGQLACSNMFRGCTGITSANLSSLTTVSGSNACSSMFRDCTGLVSVDMGSVSELKRCDSAFDNCTILTNVNLNSLTKITGNCASMFSGCSSLTNPSLLSKVEKIDGDISQMFLESGLTGVLDLSSLIVITSNGGGSMMFNRCLGLTGINVEKLVGIIDTYISQFLSYCTGLTTVTWHSLKKINYSGAFGYAFSNCTNLTSLSYPALTNNSFGTRINQFNNMLSGVTGCTIHFPSNIQAKVESLTGYPNFSGTNTTVLFDLPATVILTGANTTEYERSPKDDTATALAWRVKDTGTDSAPIIDWTPFYTSGTTDPAVSDTIYSDTACTTAVTTISSIA